jgi:hypothetical protein
MSKSSHNATAERLYREHISPTAHAIEVARRFLGVFKTPADFAEFVFEESVPEHLAKHVDWNAVALQLCDECRFIPFDGETWVFQTHGDSPYYF